MTLTIATNSIIVDSYYFNNRRPNQISDFIQKMDYCFHSLIGNYDTYINHGRRTRKDWMISTVTTLYVCLAHTAKSHVEWPLAIGTKGVLPH